MAGAGFKTFNTGDVLTSSDVNTYLMQQTVMVFDDASARSTALPTPSEGMFSYLKDTNLTYRYDGSAWLSDAGTTSPLTTKGDVWGYSTTDARIPVGANGTVLTADSSEALGVKWAAASAGALTLIQRTSFTDVANTSTTFDSVFSSTYKAYQVVIEKMHAVSGATADVVAQMQMLYSGTLQTTDYHGGNVFAISSPTGITVSNGSEIKLASQVGYDDYPNSYVMWFNNVGNTSEKCNVYGMTFQGNSAVGNFFSYGNRTNRTYTGFQLKAASGNITGTAAVYGIASS